MPVKQGDLGLLQHPASQELLASKMPARLAYIATDRVAIPPDALLAHLDRAGLSRYDMPEFLIALPEFPLTPSGKILKRALVDWVKTGRIAPEPVRFGA